jgi:hypothetical protein
MSSIDTKEKPPKGGTLNILLSELIDYAGLFPPAVLSMREAVKNFARYVEDEYAWMLGRFVLPLSRLDEFEIAAKEFLNGSNLWRLSVLCDANNEEIKKIEEFNLRYDGKAIVDAIETKANSEGEIQRVSTACGSGWVPLIFCEIPITEIPLIEKIASAGFKAKARTGGIKQEMFPTAEEIAKFILACHQSNVAFKATAGLHHPIRCVKPLTYEANAERGVMHGFLNLFLSAAFIRNGLSESEAVEFLLDENVSSFAFDNEAIHWRSYKLNANQLKDARKSFALSFGSCSFEEPIEDLKQLGVL